MEFYNFDPESYQNCTFFANIKKLQEIVISLESLHFPNFFTKCHECNI